MSDNLTLELLDSTKKFIREICRKHCSAVMCDGCDVCNFSQHIEAIEQQINEAETPAGDKPMTKIERLCRAMAPLIHLHEPDNFEILMDREIIRECPADGYDENGSCKMGGRCIECWGQPVGRND